MQYAETWIPESRIPRAAAAAFQHAVDTYASETNKTASIWRGFGAADLAFRPHERSMTVEKTMRRHVLSERRFFAEFLGSAEPAAAGLAPAEPDIESYIARLVELATPRLDWLAGLTQAQWLEPVHFFDVRRERIWVFWRRVLHSAHHRTQLTVNLRLLNRPVPAVYGPTADMTWSGASPTVR